MKGKKLLSWVLAVALVLSVSVLPAMAAFPDVPADHWALSYIDDMAAQKVLIGDDAGNFMPDKLITTGEVLAVCARIGVETELRTEIGKDRSEQIKSLMGESQTWFHTEFAVCLEAGILSYPEFKELYQSGALLKSITKEDLAVYLVRAMQLEPMAKNLNSYNLTFKDKAEITPGREPYIYLLNMYKIVEGTEAGSFQPKSNVNRAVVSAMLSRAIAFMDDRGTSVELPTYTDYDWEAGTIVSAVAGSKGVILLTLASDLSGSKTLSIPAETPIYENSMLVESALLKPGSYARVCLDTGGAAISVRLSGGVQSITGSVVGVSETAILLSVNGVSQTLGYDRFTEVQVGKKVGDISLIDLDAGYTSATCRMDQLGRMVAVQLAGGTREEEALITSVDNLATGVTNLVVTGFDGQAQKLTVPVGASVTANGMTMSALNSSYVGSYVTLRISNDDGSVVSAKVDTVTKYLQGAVKSTGREGDVDTVTITNLTTNKAVTYHVAPEATFAYNSVPVAVGGVLKDWFVTIRLSGETLDALWGYPGSTVTEGAISSIAFPSGTTQEVVSITRSDGVVVPFTLDLADPPEVLRSGKSSSLDKLRTGDMAKVTVRYGTVTRLETTPQSANMTGTISEVRQTTGGVTLTVELDADGGTKTYTVAGDVSITQAGKTISMYDLRAGYHIAMVTAGDQVASIEVDKTSSSNNELTGTIIMVNTTDKTILFRALESGGTDKIVTVSVPSGTTIQDVTTGGTISLSKLNTGDPLAIYGSYVNEQFKATLVVRK